MRVSGKQLLVSPFLGHGSLNINGRSTAPLRGLSLDDVLVQINSLSTGVKASLEDRKLVLEAEDDFTVGGHQDVLDVIGIIANG